MSPGQEQSWQMRRRAKQNLVIKPLSALGPSSQLNRDRSTRAGWGADAEAKETEKVRRALLLFPNCQSRWTICHRVSPWLSAQIRHTVSTRSAPGFPGEKESLQEELLGVGWGTHRVAQCLASRGSDFNPGDISEAGVALLWSCASQAFHCNVISAPVFSFQRHQHNFGHRWEFYICNSRFFFPLGFRATPCCFYIFAAHQMDSSPRKSPKCFLGMGLRGSCGTSLFAA